MAKSKKFIGLDKEQDNSLEVYKKNMALRAIELKQRIVNVAELNTMLEQNADKDAKLKKKNGKAKKK